MGGRPIRDLIYAAAALAFIVLVVLPLAWVIASSFAEGGSLTLVHYRTAYNANTYLLLLRSCTMAAAVGVAATLAGGFFGWLLSRTDVPFPGLLMLLLMLPLFVSPYYLAVAWRDVVFNVWGHTVMLKSAEAVGIVLFMGLMPVPLVILSASLAAVNTRLEEAGLLAAGRFRVMRSILLPLVRPAVVSSFVLVFILAVSEITVPSYFVVNLLPTELFMQFSAFYNHKAAVAIGAIVILMCIALLLLERSYLSGAPFLAIGRKGSGTRRLPLGRWKYPAFAIMLAYLAVAVAVPLIMLGLQTFREVMPDYLRDRDLPGGYLPLDRELGYTLEFLRDGFRLLKPVIADSLIYALLGAALLCLFGFVFAYASERRNAKKMDLLLLLVFAIPSTIFGIALIRFYNRPSFEFIYTSVAIVLLGYLGKFAFVSSRIIGNALKQVPASLEEAALLTGARFPSVLRHIVLPLILPGFLAAFSVCFIFCLGEMAATIVIYPPGMSLLPIKIATSMHNTPESLISAMVLIVLLITFAVLGLLYLGGNIILKRYSYGRHST